MAVIFFGNFSGSNGPAIANRSIRDKIQSDVVFLDDLNKLHLLRKWFVNFRRSKVIHLSGVNGTFSLITLVLARLLNKKITFTCHGLSSFESNGNFKSGFTERMYFHYSDKVIMLSKIFQDEIDKKYGKYKNKFLVIPNGYDYDEELFSNSDIKSSGINIVSLGGGRRNKGNIKVCKALELISNEVDFKYIIIGEDGEDTDQLINYNFVKYLGILAHSDVLNILSKSQLYIQYSELESYGIAPLEALNCRCDVIISPHFGVLESIKKIDNKIVFDCKNVNEMCSVILNKITNLNDYTNFNCVSWSDVADMYKELWDSI